MDTPVICPTFIGRTRERATLGALLDAVTHKQGRAATISGEAGIGKSRLVAETKRAALAQGFLIVQGQCFQADAMYPYAPLLDLLRGYLPDRLSAIVAGGQEPLARELVQLLPDLSLLFPQFTQPAPSQTAEHANAAQQQHRLFAILTHLLASEVAQRPILLVIEDLHWCDEGSLDFLLHLTRRVRDTPILLLFTYRNEEVPPRLSDCLAHFNREHLAHELELAHLSPSEIGAMVRALLAAPHAIHPQLVDTIYTLTEGNPFFTEEALKSLVTTGGLRVVDGEWAYSRNEQDADGQAALIPRSVRGQVQQRMLRLSIDARQALTLAAVAGRRFDFDVLQRLMGCDESQLIRLTKELIATQFVIEESADQFAFRHMLIQQAIYSSLLARERRSLHAVIANTLESLYTAPTQREAHLADLSSHFYGACSWAKALEYGQRAGEKILALYAPRAAIEHATHALEAAHHLHITPPGKIYYTRGQAYDTLGEFARARSDYEQALEAATLDADDALQWQSMTALGFLWAERDYAQAGVWFRRASDVADQLADPAMQARSLNRLGNWLGNTGRIEEGIQAHRDAFTVFEKHRDIQGMAETLDLLSTMHGMRGARILAVEELGQAIALFRTLGDTQSLISGLAMRALQSMPGANETTFWPHRTRDECVQDALESLDLARQVESLAGQAFAEAALAHVLTSFGEFGAALEHAHEASRIASAIEHQQWQISSWYGFGRIYLLLLSPDRAITALESGLSLARELGSTFWIVTLLACLGRAHMLHHDLAAAQATLQIVMPSDQRPHTIAERDIALAWAELALAQSEPDVALRIAEYLLASAPQRYAGQPMQPIPHILHVKGAAMMSLSRHSEAMETLENARHGAQERNARPLLWTIHCSLGRAYQHLQRNDEARRENASARRLIEELASTVNDTSLRDQFIEAASDALPKEKPLAPREADRQASGGLTVREREVAALLAKGKTSRQIADELVVSERTAEVHVGNILKKLGFSSRTQIAVWAVERGLAND